MLTQDQINNFTVRAKQSGYSDADIQAEIERKKREGQPTQPTQPITTGMDTSTAIPEDKSLLSKIGGGALDIAKSIFAGPKNLGEAAGTIIGIKSTEGQNQKNQASLDEMSTKLRAKAIKIAKSNPEQAKRLLDLAEANQMFNNEQLQAQAQEALKQPEKVARGAVGTAALAVPYSRGANFLTKAVVPGAVQGAGLTAGQEGTTLEEIAGGAVIGGATAGVLSGAGKVVNKVMGKIKGAGGKVEQIGQKMQESVTKVRVRPSVYGAAKEDAINQTLRDLKITGTADQKYRLLGPKMQDVSGKIYDELVNNPKTTTIDAISKDFRKNLESELRSKSLNDKTINKEIDGYIQDLYKAATGNTQNVIPKNITNIDLFRLKQLANEDLQGAFKKLNTGQPLTDREKVIMVGRNTLDDIISEMNPEVKKMTIQQSHLFDAAPSIAKQRDVVPTTRIAGTTVPSAAVQKVQDVTGRGVEAVGGKFASIPNVPEPSGPIFTGANIGALQFANQPSQSQQNQPYQENAPVSENNANNQDTNIIPQTGTGYTVAQWLEGMSKAAAAGNTEAYNALKKQKDLEVEYQKNLGTKGGVNVTKVSAQNYSNSLSGSDSLQKVNDLMFSNGKINHPLIVALKTPGTPNQDARQIKAYLYNIADSYLRLRTGAQANPTEIQRLASSLEPGLLDTTKTVKTKLGIYETVFNEYIKLSKDQNLTGEPTDLYFQNGQSAVGQ